MSRMVKKMPSFNTVTAGETATCNLPVGLTYDAILLNVATAGTALTEAQMRSFIDEVRIVVDGDVKITASGAELLDINKNNKVKITDGVFPIIFSDPNARTPNGESDMAWGTADVSTFSVEVDLNSSWTSPTLKAKAEQSAPTPLGLHKTLRRFGRVAGGTGVIEEANLPRGGYGLVALHYTTANIGNVEVEINNKIVHESDAEDRAFLQEKNGYAPQAGVTHIRMLNTRRVSDSVPLNVQDFRVRTDHTDTGSYNILMERLETHTPNQ